MMSIEPILPLMNRSFQQFNFLPVDE